MNAIKSFFKIILYQPLYNALIFLIWLFPGNNAGIAIVILTILIRLALVPSSAKAIESQRQLKELQPEMDKIKKKYQSNQQAQAQAMMALYQRNKINPLSGCLPLLIQLPIMYILYYVFRDGLDTNRYDLLYSFTPRPEIINTVFLGMDLNQPSVYLAIITGILQFWQTKQIMPAPAKPKPNQDKEQPDTMARFQSMFSNQMIYIMPIFTIIIGVKLPAALILYWAITTLFAIGQQYWILKKSQTTPRVKISVREK